MICVLTSKRQLQKKGKKTSNSKIHFFVLSLSLGNCVTAWTAVSSRSWNDVVFGFYEL